MSLRGKDFRCELDPELHQQSVKIAEHENKDIKILGAELLEKAIAGEFHAFRVMLERLERCGILRTNSDKGP